MTAYYVRSGAGGTNDGTSWTNAYTLTSTAVGSKAARSTYYLSEDDSETYTSTTTIAFPGTAALPDTVVCANHAGSSPPVGADVTTGAVLNQTAAGSFIINGSANFTGMSFSVGDGSASTSQIRIASAAYNCQIHVNSQFAINSSSGSAGVYVGSTTQPSRVRLQDCRFTFSGTLNSIGFQSGEFLITGSTNPLLNGGVVPSVLCVLPLSAVWAEVVWDGVDLSQFGSGKTLVATSSQGANKVSFLNCKLGASVTICATPSYRSGVHVDVVNCDSGAAGYRSERYWYEGTLKTETTIVRSGGASDGHQSSSWNITTTANSSLLFPFICDGWFELGSWNETVGSAVTLTIEILNNGTILTNADIWADVEYLGSSSFPLAYVASSGVANALTTGTNITASSATWTTTGLSNPVAQKIQVTFTPQMAGLVRVKIKSAKASKTIYVDPKATLS